MQTREWRAKPDMVWGDYRRNLIQRTVMFAWA